MQTITSKTWIILIGILCICTPSCKKFLASYSQNKNFIESARDLDELLVGGGYLQEHLPIDDLAMDDDIDLGKPDVSPYPPSTRSVGFHYWQAEPRMDTDSRITNSDLLYNSLYKKIGVLNTILYNVDVLKSNEKILKRVAGEAHFLRAYYYFILSNVFGKPYHATTASVDFGVPLKTDPSIKTEKLARSSMQQVYDQILKDLLLAENELIDENETSTIRANQAAVRSLLSKVYLYMEDYTKSVIYADKVIELQHYKIKDFNQYVAGKDFLTKNSSEVIFTMGRIAGTSNGLLYNPNPVFPYYKASEDLMQSFSEEDLRLNKFFYRDRRGNAIIAKKIDITSALTEDVSYGYFLRLSELYLNKAEALAALDRFEEARNTLQEFRKNRFKPGELPPIDSEGAILVNAIREERRRELCFESHRWFDLRRYGVNSKYPFGKTIQHRSFEYIGNQFFENGYYELKPYAEDAAAYIVPIASDEIEFHKGLLINEPRPNRPLIK